MMIEKTTTLQPDGDGSIEVKLLGDDGQMLASAKEDAHTETVKERGPNGESGRWEYRLPNERSVVGEALRKLKRTYNHVAIECARQGFVPGDQVILYAEADVRRAFVEAVEVYGRTHVPGVNIGTQGLLDLEAALVNCLNQER